MRGRDRGSIAVVGALVLLVTTSPRPSLANALPYYHLPWDADVSHVVTQGNNQGDHIGFGTYAWDFGGGGWLVRATFDGTVSGTKDDSNTGGCAPSYAQYANFVRINDSTGYQQLYLHLLQGSVSGRVSLNQSVTSGTPLGQTDNTGYSCGNHLHYQVQDPNNCSNPPVAYWCNSVPSSFVDPNVLSQDSDGVPRTNQTVVSDNEWIKLTSGNFSFSVPGAGGSRVGPSVQLSGNFNWQIRVTGSAGNYASTSWPGTLTLGPDIYWTTIYLVGTNGINSTTFQFYGTVCGQTHACAQLNWPQPGSIITLGSDSYTAWSHLYN